MYLHKLILINTIKYIRYYSVKGKYKAGEKAHTNVFSYQASTHFHQILFSSFFYIYFVKKFSSKTILILQAAHLINVVYYILINMTSLYFITSNQRHHGQFIYNTKHQYRNTNIFIPSNCLCI